MLKRSLLLSSLLFVATSSLEALTLRESIVEAMDTNPVVQERLKNYRATQQDLNIAESEYYPKLDLRLSVGYNKQGMLKTADGAGSDYDHPVLKNGYGSYESSITLTQNLFDGFGTMYKVDYQEARILAAAYNYVEKANDIAFKMTNAYLNVLRAYELVQIAKDAIKLNEDLYGRVKDLYNAGLTTDSEVKKIESALALSRSNLIVQLNNAKDTEFNFRRILGRMPDVTNMVKPNLDVPMPESQERAALYAINHNPSLLVSNYNIKGAQALWKQHKKSFYPTVDFEVSQTYNDFQDRPAIDQTDDRFKAKIILNYNIFRGGADKATAQKDVSKINQEVAIKRDLKRQVIEGLDLSWSAYTMIAKQLKNLYLYNKFSEKTLRLYKEEYDLGQRSLLDLLAAQNDVINSRSQIVTSEYQELFAKYRILDAMGLLPMAVIGNTQEFAKRVNLYTGKDAQEILDELPEKFDVDHDNIVDNEDLCDNSLLENNIMPYGCKKATMHIVKTSIVLDSDKDGVEDSKDQCFQTPLGYKVDAKGCAKSVNFTINFAKAATKVPSEFEGKIKTFAQYMKDHPQVKAKIIGHTSKTKNSSAYYNMKLSKERAQSFKDALVQLGIKADRLSVSGAGYLQPIADNNTQEGRQLNRRIEIKLTK